MFLMKLERIMSFNRLLILSDFFSYQSEKGSTASLIGKDISKLWITMGKMGIKRHVFKLVYSENVFNLSHIFRFRTKLCFI